MARDFEGGWTTRAPVCHVYTLASCVVAREPAAGRCSMTSYPWRVTENRLYTHYTHYTLKHATTLLITCLLLCIVASLRYYSCCRRCVCIPEQDFATRLHLLATLSPMLAYVLPCTAFVRVSCCHLLQTTVMQWSWARTTISSTSIPLLHLWISIVYLF